SIVCVMGAVGAVWTAPLPLPWAPAPSIHLREEGAAFEFCSLCSEAPQRQVEELGSQGPPPEYSFWGGGRDGGLLTRGLMRGCPFLGSSAAKCSLLLRPPSRGEASPWLPVFVTHPVHHQQLATCLGPHGGSWWGHHPGSGE
uniref:Uncharacterized protein n=1 Tax=Nomascus leucogenys TaxID=61853 RepID=A0A2I3HD47_NOMLE